MASRGQVGVAGTFIEEARALLGVERSYHALASISIAVAHLELTRGRFQDAADALAPVAAVADEVPQLDQQILLPWRLPYGLALTAVGRLDEATEQAQRLATYAANQRIGSVAAGAARLRAAIAASRGEIDTACADYADAAEVFAAIPMPFEAALAAMGHGSALRRFGRPREAIEQLESARSVLARLGAGPFLLRCEAEITEADVSVGTAASVLSPAEAAVAGLVAEGLSNRQVAEQLVLSVRTVEHHLRSIYAKLRLSSRTQLVALLRSK
jgi:DNA-binding CsgD family transcriptional regulator